MEFQLIINEPVINEIAFEIVALPVTVLVLIPEVVTKEENTHVFVPDRRSFTFRLLGKPSLGQSPPFKNNAQQAFS
jgi:hypothetical protein